MPYKTIVYSGDSKILKMYNGLQPRRPAYYITSKYHEQGAKQTNLLNYTGINQHKHPV